MGKHNIQRDKADLELVIELDEDDFLQEYDSVSSSGSRRFISSFLEIGLVVIIWAVIFFWFMGGF